MITYAQAQWAKQHDWFRDYCPLYHAVLVRDYTEDGIEFCNWFTNFQDLRAWAGY